MPVGSYVGDGYEAFKERDLHDHPLFNKDVAHLGTLVWDCITPAIPRAMAFMGALQEIGSWVGEGPWHGSRSEWGPGSGEFLQTPHREPSSSTPSSTPLWVIQAKSKASRKQVTMRGFHLPDLVRRVTLMANLNEIDPRAHRTGIVANFVHSLDAAHLAALVSRFRQRGGSCVGSLSTTVCWFARPRLPLWGGA
jgi:hypothetical protein